MRLILFFCCIPFMSFAQEHLCGADELHEQLLNVDIEYSNSIELQNSQWADFIKNKESNHLKSNSSNEDVTEYEIPVVVHIVHTGEPIGSQQNPSDSTIISAIEELNQKFNAVWPGYPGTSEGGVAVPFTFKLAKRTPDCEPTNGIIRVDGSNLSGYDEYGATLGGDYGTVHMDVKALSIWPNTEYLNIWVVKWITSADGSSGVLGFATYPESSSHTDGVVIRCDRLISYTTLTHEVGHIFGLRHTFQGYNGLTCPSNDDCATEGDFVCDTDPVLRHYNCPTDINPCTGNSFIPTINNIMGYSSCQNRFTEGQKERMFFMFNNYRASLRYSFGGTGIGEEPEQLPVPIESCVPQGVIHNNSNANIGIHSIELNDLFFTSKGLIGDGGYYIDNTISTCLKRQRAANIVAGQTYNLSVRTSVHFVENVRGWIDFNNNGIFEESELVISSNGTESNQLHTTEFTVPANTVLNTSLRMRLASDFYTQPAPEPCGTFHTGQAEDYIVRVTNNTMDIDEFSFTPFKTYPNPTNNILNFSEELQLIEIYTTDGKRVLYKEKGDFIDVSNLPGGLYFLKGENTLKNSARSKFVKY